METMRPDKGVFKRRGSSLWQHRIFVAKDLRPLYGNKDVLPAKSLGTADLAEANRRARQRVAEFELEFAAQREKLKPTVEANGIPVVVTNEQIERWTAEHRDKVADADFEARVALHTNAQSDPHMFWSGKLMELPAAWGPDGRGTSYWEWLSANDEATLEQGVAFVLWAHRRERIRILREALQAGRTDLMASVADSCLSKAPSSPAQRLRLIRRLMQAEIAALEDLEADVAAAFPELSGALNAPAKAGTENPPLSAAVTSWLAEKATLGLTGRRIEDCKASTDLFIEIIGDKSVASYSKGHVREFKEVLRHLPANRNKIRETRGLSAREAADKARTLRLKSMTTKTANKYLSALYNLFEYIVGNYDAVDRNVFVNAGLAQRSTPREEWDSFTCEALTTFFSAPLYTGCRSAKNWLDAGQVVPRDSARFWVPLILLFTGARVNEICKLRVADVREAGGLPYFSIEWEDDDEDDRIDGRVKTSASERIVPVHSDLVSFGLLEFVKRAQTREDERLFSELKPNRHGKLYDGLSKRFSDTFLPRLGIKTPKTSLKSFRHQFVDAATNSRIPDEIILALKGDSRPGTLARYGDGKTDLEILAEEMGKLRFKGLSLDHLRT